MILEYRVNFDSPSRVDSLQPLCPFSRGISSSQGHRSAVYHGHAGSSYSLPTAVSAWTVYWLCGCWLILVYHCADSPWSPPILSSWLGLSACWLDIPGAILLAYSWSGMSAASCQVSCHPRLLQDCLSSWLDSSHGWHHIDQMVTARPSETSTLHC